MKHTQNSAGGKPASSREGKSGRGSRHRDFYTFSEVQSYLGIKSRKTILKYIKSGQLPAYKVGGTRWRISRKDVEQFLEDCMIWKK